MERAAPLYTREPLQHFAVLTKAESIGYLDLDRLGDTKTGIKPPVTHAHPTWPLFVNEGNVSRVANH